MKTPDYEAVLEDLKSKRDAIDQVITGLESILPRPVIEPAAPTPRVKLKAILDSPPERPPDQITIEAAILQAAGECARTQLQAAGECARTQSEVMDRVEQIRPGSNRPSIYAGIQTLGRKGRLHKDDSLKLRLVENGRICA